MSEDLTLTQNQAGHFYTDQNSGALRARRYRVQVVAGPDAGIHAELEDGTFIIGTHQSTNMRLTDKGVSRYHVELQLLPGGLKVTDLDSTNGVFQAGAHGGARVGSITITTNAATKARFRLGTVTEIEIAPADLPIPTTGYQGETFGRVIGGSKFMRELFGLLSKVAPTEATVLLEGETGTGKELLAEAIHLHSPRKGGAYVVVDCGSLPKDLIGSELFGHVRGAFTGAVANKRGLIEEAEGGTLFLDEIGELPLDLQPKLLRALEKGEIKPVGGEQRKTVDVRVVAATNRALDREVEAGNFREDLYYRLAVIKVRLPALRQRPEDIPLLVEHFLAASGAERVQVGWDTMRRLQAHPWPGNVRELKNYVDRAVVLAEHGRLETRHLSSRGMREQAPVEEIGGGEGMRLTFAVDIDLPFKDAKSGLLDAFETRYWQRLLEATQGNISEAARRGGIHRKSLEYIVKKLDLKGQ